MSSGNSGACYELQDRFVAKQPLISHGLVEIAFKVQDSEKDCANMVDQLSLK